ncbi:hypothetical protein ACWOC1_06955 [Enterococcus quebecensis]|uniref:Uncharacterized protein n=1 Tax=Enterococcus quebecensis TaxID=903983 RepID=A0A1E5GS30_9ENTE|nr:hypothetical protein [Enterococcus quebecensis]OEG15497.1 hypothetical protein BCR23_08495 [Enterococcus quebecensis]OJG74004.1 hypothetical protein RV12_GL000352 [Enterococcus quebecensis]
MKNSIICIKTVPYQEILNLRDSLERLESWKEPLEVLEKYFTNSTTPINKKQVVKQYYASAKLFETFHKDYALLINESQKQLASITQNQKI